VERGTFPKIRDAFDDFVVARLSTSGVPASSFNRSLQIRFLKDVSLPRYLVLDPLRERVLRDWAFQINFKSNPKSFSKLLEEGKQLFGDSLKTISPKK